ncbi:amidohydrolase family protein [Pseudoruegeria sp. HB172150]|uniref:amidohydrolase family protein n=1 Tax=Pseudoruegeria sp. HB172150 TaxID=2721164 RepID=UPI001553A93C|nr:amidohydrolase family protein [Pseudoruegeria sp. HB172150]
MADLCITNCHIHLFTRNHIPSDYPSPLLRPFRRLPFLVRFFAWVARVINRTDWADMLDRLYRFQQESDKVEQREILEAVRGYYPEGTRFVVLPMDMSCIGYGPVPMSLKEQHDELNRLQVNDKAPGSIIPFATMDPRSQASIDEGMRAIRELQFKGLKLYPRLGFAPDDPALMDQVYPNLAEQGLPVMTHCSRGGVQGRELSDFTADRYSEPDAFLPVLQKFPKLRVCLAHFGGQRDWEAYARGEAPTGNDNWQVRIRRLICSDDWPGLWTDISYTLFYFDDYIPYLRIFLLADDDAGKRLRERVLFGSDFYMTRREALSERDICFRLRNALGEETFRQIAETNPHAWLTGEGL